MRSKRIVAGLGLLAAAVALAVVPDAGRAVPVGDVHLLVVGATAALVGVAYLAGGEEASTPTPPTPETRAELPAPGEAFERKFEELSTTPFRPSKQRRWEETRAEVESTLRAVTVATLADRYNLTRRRAEALVESGRWTEDPHAAAFFTGRYEPDGSGLRLRPWRTGTSAGKQAGRVVDELAAIEGGERLLPGDATREEAATTAEPDTPGRTTGSADGGESR